MHATRHHIRSEFPESWRINLGHGAIPRSPRQHHRLAFFNRVLLARDINEWGQRDLIRELGGLRLKRHMNANDGGDDEMMDRFHG